MSTELLTSTTVSNSSDRPPLLSRNSQLNLRPQEINNTNRIRSRSVSNSRASSSTLPSTSTNPLNINLDILPTITSSPLFPDSSFESIRSGINQNERRWINEEGEGDGNSGAGTEDYSPITQVDVVVKEDSGKSSLKGFTSSRKERERGKSFTTLLVRGSPVVEKEDPIISAYPNLIELPILPTKSLKDFIPQLLILLALFLSSFLVIAILIQTLPALFIPHSPSELPSLINILSEYQSSSFLAQVHLFSILSLLYCWKQAYSIPGSILSNILFGALYGAGAGSLIAYVWTAVGSTGSYYISIIISPLIEYYFAKPLSATRRALNLPSPSPSSSPSNKQEVPISKSDIFSHLLLARFFPLIPYSLLNVICGVLELPVGIFFTTLVIGSFPFNFVTVSIGSVIATAASQSSTIDGVVNASGNSIPIKIWSKEVLIKLVLVTLVSILPLLFKKRIQNFVGSQAMIDLITSLSRIWQEFNEFIGRKMVGLRILRFGFSSSTGGRNGNVVMSASDRRRKNRSWLGDLSHSMSRSGSRESSEGDGSILG